eukprot:426412-Rhodomonas_salina.3
MRTSSSWIDARIRELGVLMRAIICGMTSSLVPAYALSQYGKKQDTPQYGRGYRLRALHSVARWTHYAYNSMRVGMMLRVELCTDHVSIGRVRNPSASAGTIRYLSTINRTLGVARYAMSVPDIA